MKCPRCGGQMEERENRQTRQKFYGCANYPACRMTMTPEAVRNLTGAPPQSMEEEEARLAGEDRDTDQPAEFWGDRDAEIPEDMSREDI